MPGLVAGHVCFCGVDRRYPAAKGIHRRRAWRGHARSGMV